MQNSKLIKYISIIVMTVFVFVNIGINALCVEKFKSFMTLDTFSYGDIKNVNLKEFVETLNASQNSIRKATDTFEKLGYENALGKGRHTATDEKSIIFEWIKSKDKDRLRILYGCSWESRPIYNKIKFRITLCIS